MCWKLNLCVSLFLLGAVYSQSLGSTFHVSDLCAYEIRGCQYLTDPRCQLTFAEYCACVSNALSWDGVILLDATNGIQTATAWNGLTRNIGASFNEWIVQRDSSVTADVFYFGDNHLVQSQDISSVDFPAYSTSSACAALQGAAANLATKSNANKVIFYFAWSSFIGTCDLSSLVGMTLYVVNIPLATDLTALSTAASNAGVTYVQANYCTTNACLQSIYSTENNAVETHRLIIAYLSDWLCENNRTPAPTIVSPQDNVTPSPSKTPTWFPTWFPSPSPTPKPTPRPTAAPVTPAPIAPVLNVPTPQPTPRVWFWTQVTPRPTPAPVTPPLAVTPTPTERKNWRNGGR